MCLFPKTGQISVPDKIAEDTMIIDLQNNDITEIQENDFIGLHKLYVRNRYSGGKVKWCWIGMKLNKWTLADCTPPVSLGCRVGCFKYIVRQKDEATADFPFIKRAKHVENSLEFYFNFTFADSEITSYTFSFTWKIWKPFLKCYVI